ncbi:hypothetical protein [Bacteroides sp. 51]|uniref:hypothetical protein n=1 Tax=Bacteroides sp. 51 TaxID=2302938 RepID=UPI0013D5BED4|nr:hypothetical protein [Bacteroides sp. 51]NDV80795.1 hypothetical protein [Bacteroides sp. 51]
MSKEKIFNLADSFTNEACNATRKEFLEEMKKLHPTIQQMFAGLVLSWLKDYATNYRQDPRNKHSIEECQKLIDSYTQIHGSEELRERFPMI